MNNGARDRVGPMLNPPHLGELIRESMDKVSWNVIETVARSGSRRGTLSRLLNVKAGVSANMRWRGPAGVSPIIECGCRRVTNLHGRAGTGSAWIRQ